jgi:hypothetical protein
VNALLIRLAILVAMLVPLAAPQPAAAVERPTQAQYGQMYMVYYKKPYWNYWKRSGPYYPNQARKVAYYLKQQGYYVKMVPVNY